MSYKQTPKGIGEIGRELGVSHALEGGVRRGGGRVRITAQLIQVSDQSHVWAESFEREAGDVLSLQTDVARAVARAIGVQLTPQETLRLSTARPIAPDVSEAYLKGRYYWKKRTREALRTSVAHFTRAIELDPAYAAAYAGLADVHLTQMDYNYERPRDTFETVERLLAGALRLDDMVAEPYTSLGHLRFHQFDWRGAEQAFVRAATLNPGYDGSHYYYANLLSALGRFDEAAASADRSLALDPLSLNTRRNRVFVHYLARRYDDALRQLSDILAMDPGHTPVYYDMGLIHERLGDYDRAIESFRAVTSKPYNRGATVASMIAFTQARAGRLDEAAASLAAIEERPAGDYMSLYDVALVHFALGAHDRGFARLQQACDEYASMVPFINIDARLDGVRADPRCQALIDRLNLR
jgi:tetratricopeptide (TPR) repeat protein